MFRFHKRFHRDHGRDHGGHDHRGRDHGCDGERRARGEFGYRDWFGHRGGRHGGGFRGGRMFEQGDLRFVILHLLSEKPRHGYEIIKAIEESVGGAYSPSPGVIYPTLTLLEELGHVAVHASEGTKKLHSITPDGRAHLKAYRPTVEALLERTKQIQGAHGGGPPSQIARAMENLHLALRTRLARSPLSEKQADAVATAIDAAAIATEQA